MRALPVLLLVLAPLSARAAFDRFYTDPFELELDTPTAVSLYYDTNSVDLSGLGATGVFGWGGVLQSIGSLTFLEGWGDNVDELSTCLGVTGVEQNCAFLDAGAGAIDGIEGTAVHMMTMMVMAREPGDGILATTMDLSDGDFTTASAGPVVLARAPGGEPFELPGSRPPPPPPVEEPPVAEEPPAQEPPPSEEPPVAEEPPPDVIPPADDYLPPPPSWDTNSSPGPQPVPEPSALLLFVAGLGVVAWGRRVG